MKILLELKVGERYTLRGRNYQVESIDSEEVQLRAVDAPLSVTFQTLAALQLAHDRGHLRRIQEAPIAMSPEKIVSGLNKSQAETFKIRSAYIQVIMHSYNGICSRTNFATLQRKVAEWIGEHACPAYSTVCEWRRRYLKAGGNPIALLPNTFRPHRKHFSNQPQGVQVMILDILETVYWVRTPFSKKDTATAIQLTIKDENKHLSARSQYKIPSASTLWRIISEQDHYRTMVKQKGTHAANKKHHSGEGIPEPSRLFERVEADTLMLHIFAFDERSGIAARPFITLFMEVKTRYVIAWTISFDPPSEETTLLTLKKSISSSNPHGGVSEHWLFDNGCEFISIGLRHLLELFFGEESFCKPYSPNEKPHIERLIETYTQRLIHRMKGTTFSNPEERGNYDSEKNAFYSGEQLRHYFTEFLEIYHNEYHSALGMSPNEAWAKCQELEFEPRRYGEDDLRRMFWTKEIVTPHYGRVRAHNLFWQGPGIAELANRYPMSKSLYLYFDPCDVGQACVCHPKYPMDLKFVTPLKPDYQNGLTLSFHQQIHSRKLELRKQQKYVSANEAMVQLLLEIARRQNTTPGNQPSSNASIANSSVHKSKAPSQPTAETELEIEKSHYRRDDTPEDFAVRTKKHE